jgi:hypothetical protein
VANPAARELHVVQWRRVKAREITASNRQVFPIRARLHEGFGPAGQSLQYPHRSCRTGKRLRVSR